MTVVMGVLHARAPQQGEVGSGGVAATAAAAGPLLLMGL